MIYNCEGQEEKKILLRVKSYLAQDREVTLKSTNSLNEEILNRTETPNKIIKQINRKFTSCIWNKS